MSDVKLLVGILEKIANICKDNMTNTDLTSDIEDCFKFNDFNDYELLGKKELSEEIFNVINKGLNDG